MSYLKIEKDNVSKEYILTNAFNKPYMHISGSILPLTTNTIQGIHLNIEANNTTYRPLEYGSQSASDTYYTSAINSNGLSSTTALTRSSTSGESYLTRSSTSGTEYRTTTAASWILQYFQNQNNSTLYTYFTHIGQDFKVISSSISLQNTAYITAYLRFTFPEISASTKVTTGYIVSNVTNGNSNSVTNTTTLNSQVAFTVAKSNSANLVSIPSAYSGSYTVNATASRTVYITSVTDTKTTSYPIDVIRSYNAYIISDFGYYISQHKTISSMTFLTSASFVSNRLYSGTNKNTTYGTFTYYTLRAQNLKTVSTKSQYTATTYVTHGQTTTVSYSRSSTLTSTSYDFTITFCSADKYTNVNNASQTTKKAQSNKTYMMASTYGSTTYYNSASSGGAQTNRATYALSLRTLLSESILSESYATRSSTYSTVYLTCSSTSGYSGVSSSSSESSGWN